MERRLRSGRSNGFFQRRDVRGDLLGALQGQADVTETMREVADGLWVVPAAAAVPLAARAAAPDTVPAAPPPAGSQPGSQPGPQPGLSRALTVLLVPILVAARIDRRYAGQSVSVAGPNTGPVDPFTSAAW